MTQEEWGPWIEHDGRVCPVPVGTYVMTFSNADGVRISKAGMTEIGAAGYRLHGMENVAGKSKWIWLEDGPGYFGVIRYRIRKPRGLTILQRIAEQPQKERVEA